MTLYPFLIGYYVAIGIFVILNFFALHYIRQLKYLGPGVVNTVLIVYLIFIIAVLIISHIFIFQFNWNQELFSF